MTKKHFIRLADYICTVTDVAEPFTPAQIEHLADFCHEQDLKFDRERWIGYIKGENGPSGGQKRGKK